MGKTVLFRIFIAGILVFISALMSHAQDVEPLPAQQGYDLIVNEALDQIEESFDPATEEPAGEDAEAVSSDGIMPSSPVFGPETGTRAGDLEEADEGPEEDFERTLETKIIPLLHAEASGIVETLEWMKSPDGDVTYNEQDRTLILKDTPGRLEVMSVFVKGMDIPLETEVFRLEHIKAEDIMGDVEKALTEGIGQARPDEALNSIAVTDTPVGVEKIRQLVERADHANRKILIETKVLQIVLNDEHRAGVDWEATVSDYQRLVFSGFTARTGSGTNGRLSLGTVSKEDYHVLLDALDTAGIVHEISDETIETEHEKAKTVSILSSLLRDLGEADPDTFGDGEHAGLLKEMPRGEEVQFRITPAINRDGTLTVSVEPGLVGEISLPAQERVTVQVGNGETVVIGSLFEEVMVESVWKIPLLGDLPLLGFVFRNQGEVPRRAEIVTFLTVRMAEKEK